MASKFKVDLANLFTNWDNDVGAWASSTGGAGIVAHPVSGDAATLDGNSGNVVVNVASACSSLAATAAYGRTMSGSQTLNLTGTGTVWSWGAGTLTYSGTITISDTSASSKTFSGNGKTYGAMTIASGTGNVVVSGDNTFLAITSSVGTGAATLDLTGAYQTVTNLFSAVNVNAASAGFNCGQFVASGIVDISGGAEVTLTGTGVVWDARAASVSGNGTIFIVDSSSATKTFHGGTSNTYGGIANEGGGTGAMVCTGVGVTLQNAFSGGISPLVFTGASWTFNNDIFLDNCPSVTGGTWIKTSGTVIAPSGCVITNNKAIGGATWDATAAIYGGGDTGQWNFGHPVPGEGQTGLAARFLEWGRHVGRYWRRIR